MDTKAQIVYLPDHPSKACISKFYDVSEKAGTTDLQILETIFKKFNRIDGEQNELDAKMRSMCVGDIVSLFDENGIRDYICDTCGWKKVSKQFLEAYSEAKLPFIDRALGLDWLCSKHSRLAELMSKG